MSKAQENELYAVVSWQIADIKRVKPHWSSEKCQDWLERSEEHTSELQSH